MTPPRGAAQGLVGGGGGDVGNGHRARVEVGGDEPRHVGHVHQQIGAHLVGDGAKAGPIHAPRIGGKSGHDHFWAMLMGQAGHLVVVHLTGSLVQPVLHGVVEAAGKVHLGTVGQVPAVVEAHAKHGVAGLQQRQVHGGVGLGSGVRLHVGVVRAEQRLDPLNGQHLGLIDVLAAAVVALVRIALGVLVGQRTALRLPHQRARVVFRSDQLDVLLLAAVLKGDGIGDFRIKCPKGGAGIEHGRPRNGSRKDEETAIVEQLPAAQAPALQFQGEPCSVRAARPPRPRRR